MKGMERVIEGWLTRDEGRKRWRYAKVPVQRQPGELIDLPTLLLVFTLFPSDADAAVDDGAVDWAACGS